MTINLSPQEAWEPLPASEWNLDAARHLLRRAGWSATPDRVQDVFNAGLDKSLASFFPEKPVDLHKPKLVDDLEENTPDYARRIVSATAEQRRELLREARDRSQAAAVELTIQWLQQASKVEFSPFEKWMLFLEDVWVITTEKVKNASLVFEHQDILRKHALGPYPAMAKAISRSPAMVQFLDLQQSQVKAPNENFARELFELFLLGEGNYTEGDIKEAAKAFTGYRQRFGKFFYVPGQHDGGPKTVFGETGNFSGDDVIDLAFKQKATGKFLPTEMARWYLSESPLPPPYGESLGEKWAASDYSLRYLLTTFFSSRLFYAPEFRANYIKSPVQFYLGLIQDLDLDVTPLQRSTVYPLRIMGQMIFNPPNVRGWVGGKTWINAATLSARRSLVESVFTPLNETNLNADEQIELAAARSNGMSKFSLSNDRFKPLAELPVDEIVNHFTDNLLAVKVDENYHRAVREFLESGDVSKRLDKIRNTAVTLLQSPEYQLC